MMSKCNVIFCIVNWSEEKALVKKPEDSDIVCNLAIITVPNLISFDKRQHI